MTSEFSRKIIAISSPVWIGISIGLVGNNIEIHPLLLLLIMSLGICLSSWWAVGGFKNDQ